MGDVHPAGSGSVVITRVVYVTCDACGENDTADSADERATATEQRAELREAGWKVGLPGGRDLCPECARGWQE